MKDKWKALVKRKRKKLILGSAFFLFFFFVSVSTCFSMNSTLGAWQQGPCDLFKG